MGLGLVNALVIWLVKPAFKGLWMAYEDGVGPWIGDGYLVLETPVL